MIRVSINGYGYRLTIPEFANELDKTLWILDRALDAIWQSMGPFNIHAYHCIRNASYHLQGKHDLCR